MFSEKIKNYLYRTKTAIEETIFDNQKIKHKLDRHELLKKILSGKSRYEKLISLLRLIKSTLPEEIFNQKLLKKLFYHKKELPFDPKKYTLKENIGSGAQSKVYLLESKGENKMSWAVKITLPDRNGQKLEKKIEYLKKEYNHIKKIYQNIPGLILPEYFVILDDPYYKSKSEAFTIIQPFVSGEIKDIFLLGAKELEKIAEKNKFFRKQLKDFCSKTLTHLEKTGEIIDLFGTNNVVVIGKKGEERLVILDPHSINLLSKVSGKNKKYYLDRIKLFKKFAK